jgi:hypothetical protein
MYGKKKGVRRLGQNPNPVLLFEFLQKTIRFSEIVFDYTPASLIIQPQLLFLDKKTPNICK